MLRRASTSIGSVWYTSKFGEREKSNKQAIPKNRGERRKRGANFTQFKLKGMPPLRVPHGIILEGRGVPYKKFDKICLGIVHNLDVFLQIVCMLVISPSG